MDRQRWAARHSSVNKCPNFRLLCRWTTCGGVPPPSPQCCSPSLPGAVFPSMRAQHSEWSTAQPSYHPQYTYPTFLIYHNIPYHTAWCSIPFNKSSTQWLKHCTAFLHSFHTITYHTILPGAVFPSMRAQHSEERTVQPSYHPQFTSTTYQSL